MFAVISLFFPTFIALAIIKKRDNKSYLDLMFYYPIYNVIINTVVFLIYALKKRGELLLITNHFTILQFNLKYIIVALVVAVIFPYIKEFIEKNIRIKLEIRKDRKNEK